MEERSHNVTHQQEGSSSVPPVSRSVADFNSLSVKDSALRYTSGRLGRNSRRPNSSKMSQHARNPMVPPTSDVSLPRPSRSCPIESDGDKPGRPQSVFHDEMYVALRDFNSDLQSLYRRPKSLYSSDSSVIDFFDYPEIQSNRAYSALGSVSSATLTGRDQEEEEEEEELEKYLEEKERNENCQATEEDKDCNASSSVTNNDMMQNGANTPTTSLVNADGEGIESSPSTQCVHMHTNQASTKQRDSSTQHTAPTTHDLHNLTLNLDDFNTCNDTTLSGQTSENSNRGDLTPTEKSVRIKMALARKLDSGLRRTPLPTEIEEAIQRAVANGDFEDVKSVQVHENGYLLHADTETKSIPANNSEEGDSILDPKPSKIETIRSVESPLPIVLEESCLLGCVQNPKWMCERKDHNDILYMGKKFDVLSSRSSGTKTPITTILPATEVPTLDNATTTNHEEEGFSLQCEKEVVGENFLDGSTTKQQTEVREDNKYLTDTETKQEDIQGGVIADSLQSTNEVYRGLPLQSTNQVDEGNVSRGEPGCKEDEEVEVEAPTVEIEAPDHNVNKSANLSHSADSLHNTVETENDPNQIADSPRPGPSCPDTSEQSKVTKVPVLTSSKLKRPHSRQNNTKLKKQGHGKSNKGATQKAKPKFLSMLIDMMDNVKKGEENGGMKDEACKTGGATHEPTSGMETDEGEGDSDELETAEIRFPRGVDSLESKIKASERMWRLSLVRDELEKYKQPLRNRRRPKMKKQRTSAKGRRAETSTIQDQQEGPVRKSNGLGYSNGYLDTKYSSGERRRTRYMRQYNYTEEDDESDKYSTQGDGEHDDYVGDWSCDQKPQCKVGDEFSMLKEYYSHKSSKSKASMAEYDPCNDDSVTSGTESKRSNKLSRIRISKSKFSAPSVVGEDRIRNLTVDEASPLTNHRKYGTWNYPNVQGYMQGSEDFVNRKGSLDSLTTKKNGNVALAEGGERKLIQDVTSACRAKEKRLIYTDLLRVNAQRELLCYRDLMQQNSSQGPSEQQKQAKASPDNKKENLKVRFSEVGVRTIRNQNEDQWNTTVNEMLLKSEKVIEEGNNLAMTNDNRFPRSDSARVVSAVPGKKFNFLSELLEQDKQERDELHGYQKLPSISREATARRNDKSPPHSRYYRKADPKLDGRGLSNWNRLQRSVAATPVGGVPLLAGRRKIIDPSRLSALRKMLTESNDEGVQATLYNTHRKRVMKQSVPPKACHRSPASSSGNMFKPSAIPDPQNHLLVKYSDVFNYYSSPYLRDGADRRIVDLFPRV